MGNRSWFRTYCLPAIIALPFLTFAGYMAWKEYNIRNKVTDLALSGNQHAIAILREYEKPWKLDEKVLHAALDGNPYALESLKIRKNEIAFKY